MRREINETNQNLPINLFRVKTNVPVRYSVHLSISRHRNNCTVGQRCSFASSSGDFARSFGAMAAIVTERDVDLKCCRSRKSSCWVLIKQILGIALASCECRLVG